MKLNEENLIEIVLIILLLFIICFACGIAYERQTWIKTSKTNAFKEVNHVFYQVEPIFCGKIGESCK